MAFGSSPLMGAATAPHIWLFVLFVIASSPRRTAWPFLSITGDAVNHTVPVFPRIDPRRSARNVTPTANLSLLGKISTPIGVIAVPPALIGFPLSRWAPAAPSTE